MDEGKSQAKELFVSNTFGTTPTEIFLVGTVPVFGCALFSLLTNPISNCTISHVYKKFCFFIDHLLIVLPQLLAVTILSDKLIAFNITLMLLVLVVFYQKVSHLPYGHIFTILNSVKTSHTYLTYYKAVIQIATAICILAVDFNVFPRRFAKAEVYGVGVMDMAVGSIIFSNAITSTLARSTTKITFRQVLLNLKSSLFLTGLGMIRVFFIKGSNYQEHVTEYGVNWNFFFTLAFVKFIATVIIYIFSFCQKQPFYLFLSLSIIITYQLCLSKHGLTDIIQNGFQGDKSRTAFIDANREGIFACIGFLSIYFCGVFFGKQLFRNRSPSHSKLLWILLWFSAGFLCMHLCTIYITPVSRQMANLSYYFIQIAWNSLLLFGFLLAEIISEVFNISRREKKDGNVIEINVSFLCRAITRNLLVYFLLANIFTGAINFLFDTLHCSDTKAITIIAGYVVVLNSIIWTVFILQC